MSDLTKIRPQQQELNKCLSDLKISVRSHYGACETNTERIGNVKLSKNSNHAEIRLYVITAVHTVEISKLLDESSLMHFHSHSVFKPHAV